ncbi:MAG: hypothetical protein IH939_11015 [Acidobacteria bacterium]|nr:hypothetical protein [Acidobacteriota bacterium]
MASRWPHANAEDPLAEQDSQRLPDCPGLPGIDETPAEAIDHAVTRLSRLEQNGAALGARVLLIERRDEEFVEEGRKQDSLWYRLVLHAIASVVVKGSSSTAFVPQRGVCVAGDVSRLMNYPG